jgi:lipopolysaccharide transport system ATP-binding protein
MDIEKPICRTPGVHEFTIEYPNLKLYQGFYFVRVHLAETNNTREKFSEIDCCHFEVAMLDRKAPEWGWQNNVCQYFDEATWYLNSREVKKQTAEQV